MSPSTPSSPARDSYHTQFGYLLELDAAALETEIRDNEELQAFVYADHHITFLQRVVERQTMTLSDDGESVDTKQPEFVDVDECPLNACTCECGGTFETKRAAKEHLEVAGHIQSADITILVGDPLSFAESVIEATPSGVEEPVEQRVSLEVRGNEKEWVGSDVVRGSVIGAVESPVEQLHTYIRRYGERELPLPGDYAFEEWELTLPSGVSVPKEPPATTYRLQSGEVVDTQAVYLDLVDTEAALRSLTDGEAYDRSDYALYDCGSAFPVLEGPDGDAVIISPHTEALLP